jgi:fatty acid elongase 3
VTATLALVLIHNAGLCIVSFAMCAGAIWELYTVARDYYQDDLFVGMVCDPKNKIYGSGLIFWSYVYYLTKFWEVCHSSDGASQYSSIMQMLDTYILALKKKPLTFLQMYHHFIVVILCWVLLDSGWPLQWVAVVANTTVHVFMYYYFSLSAIGITVWWKKVCLCTISSLFITFLVPHRRTALAVLDCLHAHPSVDVSLLHQLPLDVRLCSNRASAHMCRSEFPFFDYDESVCPGKVSAIYFSQGINVSFLYLFGAFYISSYLTKKPEAKDGKAKDGKAKDSSKKAKKQE